MRLPCERYVRLLFAGTRRRHTLNEVLAQLVQLHFAPPAPVQQSATGAAALSGEPVVDHQKPYREELARLQAEVEQRRPRPYLVDGEPPWDWLEAEGLLALADPDEHMLQALRILGGSESRPFAETLIIAGIPPDQASAHLTNYLGDETYTTEALKAYQDWFWRRDALSEEDWIEYLLLYPGADELLHSYLSPPWYTLVRVGVQAQELDLRSALQDLAARAYGRLVELGNRPLHDRKKDAQMFRAYAATIIDVFRETGSAARLTQLLEKLRQVGMKQVERNLPPMALLEQSGHEILRALTPSPDAVNPVP